MGKIIYFFLNPKSFYVRTSKYHTLIHRLSEPHHSALRCLRLGFKILLPGYSWLLAYSLHQLSKGWLAAWNSQGAALSVFVGILAAWLSTWKSGKPEEKNDLLPEFLLPFEIHWKRGIFVAQAVGNSSLQSTSSVPSLQSFILLILIGSSCLETSWELNCLCIPHAPEQLPIYSACLQAVASLLLVLPSKCQ